MIEAPNRVQVPEVLVEAGGLFLGHPCFSEVHHVSYALLTA